MPETLSPSFETKDDTPDSVKVLDKIESASNEASVERVRQLVPEFFASLEADAGIELTTDIQSVYRAIDNGNCIVRLGNLRKITHTLVGQDSLTIGDRDQYYPNALKGSAGAVKDAFAEGHYGGPIRPIMGFGGRDVEKTGISFSADDVEVLDRTNLDYSHPKAVVDPETFKKRRERFLCVRGELKRKEIKHLVMRTPYTATPDSILTEKEKETEPRFVFRGAILQA